VGEGIKIGYLPQTPSILNPHQKTKNYLKEYDLDENSVMYILSKLKILDVSNLAVKDLSIGEIRKIQIAAILYKNPDVLILDEPTNHLDVYTVEELVQALKEYKGTMIFVSHDKSFTNDLAPNKEISLNK
jgi:ATPase subunit of ABC transporter with duplicated ATPase domains